MQPRSIAIAVAAALLVLPAAHAGLVQDLYRPARDELAVEGHTVFTVLEWKRVEQGFDVAVLVREKRVGPNVLWFNDQWKTFFEDERYPCGGFVLATPSGVDALALMREAAVAAGIWDAALLDVVEQATGVPNSTMRSVGGFRYVESYLITDPNNFVSETDLYRFSTPAGTTVPIWLTGVLNAFVPDDGVSTCAPQAQLPPVGGPPLAAPSGPLVLYNSDVFGMWRDLDLFYASMGAASPVDFEKKKHGPTGMDNADPTACEATSSSDPPDPEWDYCNDQDDREGNSHPYSPGTPHDRYFDDCPGDPGTDHCHSAADLDVSFLYDFDPGQKNLFAALFGTTGYRPPHPHYAVVDTTP